MVYRTCHCCLRLLKLADIGHIDLFSDVCWVQCKECVSAYGQRCAVFDAFIANRHCFRDCPYTPLELAAEQVRLELDAPAR